MGDILVLVWTPSTSALASASAYLSAFLFISVHYLLNQLMDFDQKIVSQYDQEIPQSQNADKPTAPRGRATPQLRDTRKTTCIDTLLGGGKSLLYFGDLDLIFKVLGTL